MVMKNTVSNSCIPRIIVYFHFILKKINIAKYFKILTIRLHVLYTLNTHGKFCTNQMLFTI